MLNYWDLLSEDPYGQMFTWKYKEDIHHLCIPYMTAWCKRTKLEVTRWSLDPQTAAKVLFDGGVEEHRVLHYMNNPQECNRPIILISDELNRQIVADGNHRFMAKFALGHKSIRAWNIEHGDWEQFKVDVPPELSKLLWDELPEQKIDVDKLRARS